MDEKLDFTTGSIASKLTKFMIPILFALVLQSMYGVIDLLIVGNFGTTEGLSGVGTGSGVMNLVTILMAGFTTAITVLMGNYIGAGEKEKLGPLLGSSVAFFAVVSVLVSILLFVFARPMALLLQAPEEALDLTIQYIKICATGFIFICFYNFISSIFRGLGDSRTPLIFIGIATITNMILDYFFVKTLGMNVKGAAIATVLAQAISVLFAFAYITRVKLPFKFSVKDIRFSGEIKKFVQIGIPLVLQDTLTNLSFLALNAFVNTLGIDASSGYGIANRVTSFVLLIPIALIQSMAPFVSQNVGARKEDRARQGMFTGMMLGLCIGLVAGTVSFMFGHIIARAFTDDANVIICASQYLKGFALEAIVTPFLFCFLGYFNGHRKSMFVMVQGLIQTFLFRLPISYYFTLHIFMGLTGIGLAAPIATFMGIMMSSFYYLKMQKDLK
ncbi:MAG: MATE family efflux transporter [Clostridia bacterium]|nr:MATE family efflux transporter [Clostridia bacterium]